MRNNGMTDRLRGSLIGGAIGDALGYPVEFIYSFTGIQKKYGEKGITRLDTTWEKTLVPGPAKAVVSDDTQMTLFTACGLLNAERTHTSYLDGIREAYLEWFMTQMGSHKEGLDKCWIADIPAMNVQRAPGMTCLRALTTLWHNENVDNDSKGCGGVMRIAPIPLFFQTNHPEVPIEEVDRLAADASAITHLHPLGYIPSALISHVIYRLLQHSNPSKADYVAYLHEGMETIVQLYPDEKESISILENLIQKAISFAGSSDDPVTVIEQHLGGGWVAEQTVAIAVYCSLKYFNDFEKAIVASVNHGGDSDSTGAVTGNILGAVVGYDQLPQHFKEDVELHDVILKVVDELDEIPR